MLTALPKELGFLLFGCTNKTHGYPQFEGSNGHVRGVSGTVSGAGAINHN